MEDDDAPGAGRGIDAEAQELADEYQAAMVQEMRRTGNWGRARGYALGKVAEIVSGRARALERDRIALELMRRSIDLGPHGERRMVDLGQGRQRPADDPLVEGMREVVPWRWVRLGIARVLYRVLAEMVRDGRI